jgi:hypothetical protein
MTAPTPRPLHLDFDRPAGIVRPYANLYRFGDVAQPGPFVVYVGGSITTRVYEERRTSAPEDLAREFDRARLSVGLERVDVAFCPCPVNTEGLGDEWILAHYDELRGHLNAPPTALGCAGYSAGAGYATMLALTEEAEALAVFGAAGLARVLESQRDLLESWVREGRVPFEIDYFLNEYDDVERNPDWYALAPASLRIGRRQGPGAHSFRDYLANGSVFGAFRRVLQRVAGAGIERRD